ncbi:hypothetical protein [Paenibacillus sp. R14(2021)]|uniref:hypothetical protein n=1 Tax=Paenibacillus sp. R14(2021) TaxID=2859228 RepID=UPI001C61294C|nr:hypothetical protein [Paenibacillus sp. R14(2021)]
MPYKPIDFQVSIPRTLESGSQQSHINHKPIVNQTHLEHDTSKQTERLRTRNTAVEQGGSHVISSNQQRSTRSSARGKRKNSRAEEDDDEQQDVPTKQHPYKGKHIDVSL